MTANSVLRLTIDDAAPRAFRRGWWSTWRTEIVTTIDEKIELVAPLGEGRIRRHEGARYVQLDIGAETAVSKRMQTVPPPHYGV